jgi:UDP-N-acetylglucosamine 2-epimerase (non-hydrolysing)/UDP-GlcNAc3NAcA epimerase
MVDVALTIQPRARERTGVLDRHRLESGHFVLATAHRPGTVDDPQRLGRLVDVLTSVPGRMLVSLHPRTRDRLERYGMIERLTEAESVTVTPPLGYLDFTTLLCHARAVLTDSGGVQKEAYLAGVPCLTLRDRTEWVETVRAGWNTLIDLDRGALLAALDRAPPPERPQLYGGGDAGERVVAALEHVAEG